MTLTFAVEKLACKVTCATSGISLKPGVDAVRVESTCGGQHTSTTLMTIHDPGNLLSRVSVFTAAELPALKGDARHTTDGTQNCTDRKNRPQSHVCALTDTAFNPEDVILLLPSTVIAASSGTSPVAVSLTAGAKLLQPVLRAIGPHAAAAAITALPGLRQLSCQQQALTRTALLPAHRTGSDIAGETISDDREGVAAADSAAVDAAVRCDVDEVEREIKRRRLGQHSSAAAVVEDGSHSAVVDASRASADVMMTKCVPVANTTAKPPMPHRGKRTGSRASPSDAPSNANVEKASGRGTVDPRSPSRSKEATASHGDTRSGTVDGRKTARSVGAAAKPAAPKLGDAAEDLDRERAELMERNRQKLLELQLPGLVSGLLADKGHGSAADSGSSGRRQASQRGVGAKRSREGSHELPPPLRMSLRQRGVAADSALAAGIDHETSSGVQLVAGRQAMEAATGRVGGDSSSEDKSRHPKGELPFRSDNGDEATDAAFLEVLKAAAATGGNGESGATAASHASRLRGEALARFNLAERDVAKVTKDGVTHMAWLPSCERLLLAAADKGGKVSLWNIDVEENGTAADTDGVLMFSPHGEYVSGMRWLGREAAVGPCRLITAAYDGSLRALDLGGSGTWLELPAPGDQRESEHSALDVSADGRTAYLGDPLGNLNIVDLRAPPRPSSPSSSPPPPSLPPSTKMMPAKATDTGKLADGGTVSDSDDIGGEDDNGNAPPGALRTATEPAAIAIGPVGGLQICSRKINSLHLEPSNGNLLASSCSDGTVCIWDVRKLGTAVAAAVKAPHARKGSSSSAFSHKAYAPLSVLDHAKSCHAAYWAHDGSMRVLSTSYDDTIRIWSPSGGGSRGGGDDASFAQELSIAHNNQTGRWITPFRAIWTSACDAVIVGNMRRGLDVFSVGTATHRGDQDAAPGDKSRGSQGLKAGKKGSASAAAGATKAATTDSGSGQLLKMLVSEHMTAIPSRAACHPILPVVVAATSSGRCHVWR